MNNVTGSTIRRLMRQNKISIRAIAQAYNIPLARVREVRKNGGPWDWPLMIANLARAGA